MGSPIYVLAALLVLFSAAPLRAGDATAVKRAPSDASIDLRPQLAGSGDEDKLRKMGQEETAPIERGEKATLDRDPYLHEPPYAPQPPLNR